MKNKKHILMSVIVGVLLIGSVTLAAGHGLPNYWKKIGNALFPMGAYELGSNAVRIAKGWFTDLDVSGVFTLGGTVGPGGIDMNGTELILDADGDTSITADTDDQIDFRIAGVDQIVFDTSGIDLSTATSSISIIDHSDTAFDILEGTNSYLKFVTINGGEKITLGKKLEAGAVEIEGSAFDINGGTVDGITALTVANDVDIGNFTLQAKGLLADDLTSSQVVFAGANGLLSDDSDMTFVTDTLTVTNIDVSNELSVAATSTFSGNVLMADDQELCFDDAGEFCIRYGSSHDTFVFTVEDATDYTLASEGLMSIVANTGADALGGWGPYLDLQTDGGVLLDDGQMGDVADRLFDIRMDAGTRILTTGSTGAIIKADNIATSDKTFQFPNIAGTLVTTNGALANIDIGAYEFAVGATSTTHTIMPASDSTYNLGSNSVRWDNGYFDNLYINTVSWTGNLDMANNLILNIGAGGTDFTSGGGLNITTDLDVGDTLKVGTGNAFQIDASGNLVTTGRIKGTDLLSIDSGGDPFVSIGDSESGGEFGFMRWVSATDTLSFGTTVGGTFNDQLIIKESGNVGIGTSTPSALTHIAQTAASDAFRVDDQAIDTTPFVIDQSGNVGIGTLLPSRTLHINQETNAISGTNVDISGLSTVIVNPADDNDEAVGLGFGISTVLSNVGAAIIHERVGSQDYGKLHFATKPSGAASEADIPIRMTIDNAGNVGVGVVDPDTQLEVLYAGNQLKLSFDGTDNTIFAVDTSGNLTITPSGSNVIIAGDIGITGTRVTKGWFTNLESTNDITINGTALASIYSPIAGSGSITTVGTVSSGTWEATDIGVAHGGTGFSSMTQYDILFATTTTSFGLIPIGNAGEVLTVSAGATGYEWAAAGGSTAWDDIGNPDAADEIDFGAHVTELNVADFRIGDGGANYIGFDGTPTLTFNGNGDITLPALSVDAGTYAAASIDGDDINANLAGRSLTLTGASPDTLDADSELYTDTKCVWFESPTADDDFESIWRNSTANAVTMTEIWAESDQTVTFMLQVDDGSPADIDSVDLAPAAGEDEDTSLDGDTELAVDEELDLAITSVDNTPTWVSICWTFTWND